MTAQEEIRRRREALGLSKSALAREAKLNRDTLGDIEAGGGFQKQTMDKLGAALTRLEAEAGLNVPGPRPIGDPQDRLVSFEVPGRDGYIFVVKGSIKDVETLRKQAELLVQNALAQGVVTPQAGTNG